MTTSTTAPDYSQARASLRSSRRLQQAEPTQWAREVELIWGAAAGEQGLAPALELGHWARMALQLLLSRANEARVCLMTNADLRDVIGCGRDAIERALGELEAAGHIVRLHGPTRRERLIWIAPLERPAEEAPSRAEELTARLVALPAAWQQPLMAAIDDCRGVCSPTAGDIESRFIAPLERCAELCRAGELHSDAVLYGMQHATEAGSQLAHAQGRPTGSWGRYVEVAASERWRRSTGPHSAPEGTLAAGQGETAPASQEGAREQLLEDTLAGAAAANRAGRRRDAVEQLERALRMAGPEQADAVAEAWACGRSRLRAAHDGVWRERYELPELVGRAAG